jgi:hypothetical protein
MSVSLTRCFDRLAGGPRGHGRPVGGVERQNCSGAWSIDGVKRASFAGILQSGSANVGKLHTLPSGSMSGYPSPGWIVALPSREIRHVDACRLSSSTKASRRIARPLGIGVLVVAAAIGVVYAVAWLSLDRSVVARALIWLDADVDDYTRFPSRKIEGMG